MPNKKFLTIHEAADILKVSTKTLRRWESAGRLIPSRTDGGHRRYSLTQIESFKRSQKKTSPKPIERTKIKPNIASSMPNQAFGQTSTKPQISFPGDKLNQIQPVYFEPLHFDQKKTLKRAAFVAFMVVLLAIANSSGALSKFRGILGTKNQDTAEKARTENVLATRDSLLTTTLNVNIEANFESDADIAGNLNLSGNRISSSDDMVVSPGGGGVSIGTATPANVDLAGGDLFVSGDFEAAGGVFAENATITGSLTLNDEAITDLTGSGITIVDGALTSSLGTSISSAEIEDGSIAEVDLNASNTPSNGQVLTFNSSTGAFTWANDATGESSPWTLTSSVVHLDTSTDNVSLGTTSNLAKLGIVGDTDEVQFLVQGNSTQTSNLVVFENSGGTDLLTLNNSGNLTLAGDLTVTGNDIAGSGGTVISFSGVNTSLAGNLTTTGDITVNGGDITSTAALTITPGAGTNLNISLSTTGDFAVNTNQLYVDTSAGSVGIGTSSPASGMELHVAGDLQLGLNGTDGTLTLYNELGATDYSVVFQTSSSQTQTTTYTLPPDDGNANYVLTTDGSGVLTWSSVAGVGGMNSFTLSGDSGTDQTIDDADTLEVAGGSGITTTAGATDTITLAFASTELNDLTWGTGGASTITWSTSLSGATDPTLTFANSSLTIGSAATIATDQTTLTLFNTTATTINFAGGATTALNIGSTTTGVNTFNADVDLAFTGSENLTLTNTSASTDQLSLSVSGVTTDGVEALSIAFTQADDTDATDTNAGLSIALTSSSGDADTLYGINIANITGGTANEYALRIGSGFDNLIEFEGATDDSFETFLAVTDPTADRTITFPNDTGTVCLSSGNCAGGAGGSKWTDAGTFTYLTSTTDSVTIGSSTLELGKLGIVGDADEIQLIVRGNSTQTSNLVVFENSAGTDQFSLTNSGNLTLAGDLTLSGGDITGANSAAIDLGEATSGAITFAAGSAGDFVFTVDSDTDIRTTGGADGTDALVIPAGDILLSDGDLDLSGGDFNVTLDAADGVNIAKGAAPTVDVFTINGSTSTTDGVDALQLTFGVSAASGNVIDITPSYADATAGATSETYYIIDVDAFTATQNAAGDTGDIRGLSVGNLTQTETAGTISASAIRVGTGWDDILNYNGTTVINGTGQVVSTQITGTLFTLDGDDADTEAIAQGNTLLIAGGTNGIDTDVSATDTITLNFNSTEVGSVTWNAGSSDPTWTFNTSGATDPTLTFANNQITIGNAATLTATAVTTFNCTDCIDFDDLEDILDLDAALTLNQSTNTWTQNFTGTTTTGLTYNANSLTTGSALNITTSSNPASAGPVSPISFNLTNANATTATTINGVDIGFTNNPTVAGNTEYVLQIQNEATSNTTDNALAALLRLDNADTSTSGSTVVTDAILVSVSGGLASGIVDAIDASDANIDNALNAGANNIAITTGTIGSNAATVIDFASFDVSATGGAVTIAGVADGTDALTLNAGDILVSNGDLDLSGGDFNVTLDAADGVNIAKGAAPTTDVFTINGSTSTTDGVDGLQLTFGVSAASGNVIDITPSYADATAGSTSEDYFIIDIDAFTATQNAAGDTGQIRGLNIGNLTQTETAGTITASALRIGTGWDDILNYNGTTVINGSGQVVGSQITADSLDFTEFQDTLDVDAATDINLGANALTIDLDSTGDFSIRDVTTDIATFADSGAITFSPTAGQSVTVSSSAQGAADLLAVSSTWTADNTADALSITTTYNVSASTSTVYGLNLTNADNGANTGVIDALALFSNNQATETLADGIIIRHNASSGALTDALQIENTTAGGTITNAINIVETAGTITTGINIGSGVGTAIVLQNGESIDNSTNNQINLNLGAAGSLLLTSSTSSTITNSAGSIILDSTGGTIDINDATIDIATQATDLEIIDNTAAAFTISQGANSYLDISTTDTTTSLTLDLPVAGSTSTTGNLFTSNVAKTINIGTGTAADIINIGTGGTTADTITFGNTGVATTFTFNSGATTTTPLTFNLNSVTTATAVDLSLDGLTTGTGLLIDDGTAAGLSTGTLLHINSVSTALAATADSGDGILANFDWNPASSTTGTGDLFRIRLDANGTLTSGSIFNIVDETTSVFNVKETAITSALPHSFTAAGDVSIAYDLVFTNQTASTIKASGPLTIEQGESSESNNLTLRTYNSGQVLIDGTLNGTTVVSNTTSTAAGTVTVSERGVSYYLHDDSGTTNSSYTTTINVTGVPSVAGSIVFIRSGCQKGATTGSQTHTCAIQINGTQISSVATATGTGASTVIENYVAVYLNGSWRLIVGSNTSSDTADLAEVYKAEVDVDAAEVVALLSNDELKVRRAVNGDSGLVIGVTSTKPAVLIGDEFGDQIRRIAVALSGRVPVKVSPNSSAIKIGDLIGPSSEPGKARRVSGGFIVGRALESWTPGSGKETVTIFVNPIYVNETQFAQTNYEGRISNLENSLALLQAQLGFGQESTNSANFTDLTVSNINILGDAVLGDTVINGKLNVGALTFDNVEQSINAIGVLKIQDLALGNIEFLGGLITFDTDGNIIAKEVTAEKYNVSGDSAGTGALPSGETEVFIQTTAVTQNSLVFVTPKRALAFPLAVTAKEDGAGFWVELPAAQSQDTDFDWFIVDKLSAAEQ